MSLVEGETPEKLAAVGYAPSDHAYRKKLGKHDTDRPYKDVAFLVAFCIHMLVILVLAFTAGISAARYQGALIFKVSDEGEVTSADASATKSAGKVLGGITLVMLIAGVFSALWVYLMTHLSYQLIAVTFAVVLVACFVSGATLLSGGQIFGGVMLLLTSIAIVMLFMYLRPRMIFAATCLKVACEAINAMPLVLFYAIAVLVSQYTFCVIWALAAMGLATNEASLEISSRGMTWDVSECTTYVYSTTLDINDQMRTCHGSSCNACVCG
jgi:hypothetical protein